jgi:hypothetical protein
MRRIPDAAINVRGGCSERGRNAPKLSPSPEGKEIQVRTKVAMMIALTVVLVMLVGSAGTALANK